MTVDTVGKRISLATELNAGDVFQAEHLTVFRRADDNVFKLRRRLEASSVTQGVLERLVLTLADRTRRGFDVLFGKGGRDVARHELVLGHDIRFEPDAHGVVTTHHHSVADTRNTLHFWDNVDLGVVLDELFGVLVLFIDEGEHHQHTVLAFVRRHADLGHLGRQQTLCARNAVLHVHRCHVGIDTLFERNGDAGFTGIRGRRGHVVHVLYAVDLLLQGSDHAVQHRLGARTVI